MKRRRPPSQDVARLVCIYGAQQPAAAAASLQSDGCFNVSHCRAGIMFHHVIAWYMLKLVGGSEEVITSPLRQCHCDSGLCK